MEEVKACNKSKQIKTRCVVADFGKLCKYSDYIKVTEQIKDIDIAMVFINAGVLHYGKF